MRFSTAFCVAFACAFLTSAALADNPAPQKLTPQQQAFIDKINKIAAGLHPQRGEVKVPFADATLHLGNDYYFIPASEARGIIVDAWGNPPDEAVGVQGIVFPAGTSFMSDSWAAIITYEDSGYVADSDAKSTNYDDMLKQAQDGEAEENADRKAKGYEPLHLVGWAQPPYYDATHHTLVWARDLKTGNEPQDSLNYDLRALGRRGVLSMNIVAGMPKLALVRAAAAKLQNIATFNAGARYQDYKSGSDKVAEYSVGGLVAAGVGVVLVKKLGLLALGLVFIKKIGIFLVAGFAALVGWFRRMFGGKKADAAAAAAPSPSPPMEPPAA